MASVWMRRAGGPELGQSRGSCPFRPFPFHPPHWVCSYNASGVRALLLSSAFRPPTQLPLQQESTRLCLSFALTYGFPNIMTSISLRLPPETLTQIAQEVDNNCGLVSLMYTYKLLRHIGGHILSRRVIRLDSTLKMRSFHSRMVGRPDLAKDVRHLELRDFNDSLSNETLEQDSDIKDADQALKIALGVIANNLTILIVEYTEDTFFHSGTLPLAVAQCRQLIRPELGDLAGGGRRSSPDRDCLLPLWTHTSPLQRLVFSYLWDCPRHPLRWIQNYASTLQFLSMTLVDYSLPAHIPRNWHWPRVQTLQIDICDRPILSTLASLFPNLQVLDLWQSEPINLKRLRKENAQQPLIAWKHLSQLIATVSAFSAFYLNECMIDRLELSIPILIHDDHAVFEGFAQFTQTCACKIMRITDRSVDWEFMAALFSSVAPHMENMTYLDIFIGCVESFEHVVRQLSVAPFGRPEVSIISLGAVGGVLLPRASSPQVTYVNSRKRTS